jgi:hypothetical protein
MAQRNRQTCPNALLHWYKVLKLDGLINHLNSGNVLRPDHSTATKLITDAIEVDSIDTKQELDSEDMDMD